MSLEVATTNVHAAASLPDRMEYARALSTSGLLPDAFRDKPANVLLAGEVAQALGMAPIIVINEMSVIGGKPSFSAKFMAALVRRAGHRLRQSYTNGVARVVIVRSDDPDWEHAIEWDEAKARQHGYWGKSHWLKNPELMLKNRALSECVREACPEVLGGISYTPDEVADFAPTHQVEQVPTAKTPTLAEAVASHKATHIQTPTSPSSPVEAEPDGMTDAQTRKLGALFREKGITERDLQLAWISDHLGRDVASRKELSKADASSVIDALDSADDAHIDQTTGEVWDAEIVPADA